MQCKWRFLSNYWNQGAEIAAELRVPVGTVKSRLNRVLSILRNEKSGLCRPRSRA